MKTLLLGVCVSAGIVLAQPNVMVTNTGGAAQNATFQFVAFDDGGKVVTGAPYSAQVVNESTQTLADGTHITRKNTSSIYRDGAGRTRREHSFPAIGPWAAEGSQAPTIITITDPVAKETYTLNTTTKTATKMKMPEGGGMAFGTAGAGTGFFAASRTTTAVAPNGPTQHVTIMSNTLPAPPPDGVANAVVGLPANIAGRAMRLETKDVQKESLGRQVIEGVSAEGTKTSHTIPEGQIGNDRPLTSTTEQWYSADLQVTVMRKTTDPQVGENTYRLTNISRTEPDASLFQIPSDYKVEEGGPTMLRMAKPASIGK